MNLQDARSLLERAWRVGWIYALFALTAGLIATGSLSMVRVGDGGWLAWAYIAATVPLLARAATRFFDPAHTSKHLGLFLCVVMALVALSGGMHSPLYVLVYLFWIAAPTWIGDQIGAASTGWTTGHRPLVQLGIGYVVLELALACAAAQKMAWWGMLGHLIASALFVGTHRLVFGGYVRWLRRQQLDLVDQAKASWVQKAQDLRLGRSKGGYAPPEQAQRMGVAAAASLQSSMDFELDLLVSSMQIHGATLLWRVGPDSQARYAVKASHSPAPLVQGSLEHLGLLAPLGRGEEHLRLCWQEDPSSLPHYADPAPQLCAVCAVAIGQEGLEGILVVDRLEPRAFQDEELALLGKAAEHLARCLAQERAFAQVSRERQHHAQLYAASARLNQALGTAKVQHASLEALSLLLPCDLALLFAVVDDQHPDPRLVLCAQRADPDAPRNAHWCETVHAWSGQELLQSEAGLVGTARKNRMVLVPTRPEEVAQGLVMFAADSPLSQVGSAAILPLSHVDRCGAVALLLSHRQGAFEKQPLSLARILVHQIGAALQNANLYDQMQRQATTDGLTGLANHRSFQARLDEAIASAQRSKAPLSLILLDIDHFKKVNDSYGHPAGDFVLAQVAGIMSSIARKNDVVARYGGEEFVLLLPGSDAQAAKILAERLRQSVEAHAMLVGGDRFFVTLSLGIAQWGQDASAKQELIDRADQALYACKAGGRNCVRSWQEIRGGAREIDPE